MRRVFAQSDSDRTLTGTVFMAVWRRWHPRASRAGTRYVLGAVSLTVLWLAAVGLAPDAGLTRSYWYPGRRRDRSDHRRTHHGHRPCLHRRGKAGATRNYRVRWHGVWFSPRAERVDFQAGADDGVILRVDGDTVLERNPALGMHTVARTVELGAGAHRLEIEHWQDGGGRSLNVQWAPAGDAPTPLSPTRLFPEDPGTPGYWLRFAAMRLPVFVLLIWATGVAVLVGLNGLASVSIGGSRA